MPPHPFQWLSIVPPLAAIVLAIATRRVLISLLAGIYVGALILSRGNPFLALAQTCETHLWPTLADEGKLRVFTFTLLMGAMIGVVNRSGGMRGLVQVVSRWAKTRRRGQLTVWLLGLLIFFDDYANTLLLGNTLRPLCDRLKISREKLAYLVDSTAAPVAGIALVSTWIAVEIDYVNDGLNNLPSREGLEAFDLFVRSIPYRFYVLLALLLVPLTALLSRDFGPMLDAERRCLQGLGPKPHVAGRQPDDDPTQPDPETASRWYNAVLPIGLTVAVVIGGIAYTGVRSYRADHPGKQPSIFDVMGNGDSSLALQYGALSGLGLAALLCLKQRLLDSQQIVSAAAAGARLVLPAIAILWFASSLSRMTGNRSVDGAPTVTAYQFEDHRLYTGEYLQGLLLGDAEQPDATAQARLVRWLPTTVFVLAAIVSFSTGTSFGTMGMLMPMTVTLSFTVISSGGQPVLADDPSLLVCIAGVLAGAIFGDHCSPISDTTILSSQSSGCDHLAHVWTQFPYAMLVAALSVVAGTIPIGFGVSVWLLLPCQLVLLVVSLRLLGRPVVTDTDQNVLDCGI